MAASSGRSSLERSGHGGGVQISPGDRAAQSLSYPPIDLANRVGSLDGASDPMAFYDELGLGAYTEIVNRLPGGWTFASKRVLDFGCGAGRTLRHFVLEAEEAEVWGCDIDEPSIRWLNEHLCPPFHVQLNGAEPPLDQPSSSFDLIWGISVFTHLVESWSRWLIELHRLLRPEGLLYLTFMGSGTAEFISGEPWDEEKVGMNVLKYGQGWDLGGPMVMHSPWWIEEHWGRAFELVSLRPEGFGGSPSFGGHGSVLMRKRQQKVDTNTLERIAPGDSREAAALAHNVVQMRAEVLGLRQQIDSCLADARHHAGVLGSRIADLEGRLATVESSRSWNLTRPLRSVARHLRAARQ